MSDKDDDDLIGLIGTIWLHNTSNECWMVLRSNILYSNLFDILWSDGLISTKHYLNGVIRRNSTLISNHDQSK